MAYLNDWDKRIPNLDVVDDYRTERQQIQACRGKNTPFSFGDVGCTIPSFIIVSLLFCFSTSSKFYLVVLIVRLTIGMKQIVNDHNL